MKMKFDILHDNFEYFTIKKIKNTVLFAQMRTLILTLITNNHFYQYIILRILNKLIYYIKIIYNNIHI